jgi:hypothetical protein
LALAARAQIIAESLPGTLDFEKSPTLTVGADAKIAGLKEFLP